MERQKRVKVRLVLHSLVNVKFTKRNNFDSLGDKRTKFAQNTERFHCLKLKVLNEKKSRGTQISKATYW